MSIITNGGAFMYALNLEINQLVQEKESKYQGRVQLDEIMKKRFYISNKRLLKQKTLQVLYLNKYNT
jgi:hypothetical protein